MEDRGHLAVGMPADVLVYDLKGLRLLDCEVAYDFPGGEWRRLRRAEGYAYTIVKGVHHDLNQQGCVNGEARWHQARISCLAKAPKGIVWDAQRLS